MTATRSLPLAAAVCAAVLCTPAAGAASATPSVGVEARILSQSTLDGQDFITKELTIAPGGSTGWHWHPGQVYGVIRAGTLTHYGSDCDIDGVYPTGGTITEQTGPGYIHLGRNLGAEPLVMWVGYIDPAGSPQANPVPNPGCPFE
ncbi:cupin domain-containing protein [Mycolicibacterium sp. P9-22]|uniref:cupin domain-containing protein n=1 Tax=Mycolicibacterium sp. P9-22 TaxID=2024613 RepID=UPI0011ED98E0|nr:cupin domain-containing protein [Mycolicibacterium sp. P9-22]KAA0117023.1 cupin domain-containing protein [Mycolicibacterium sp. P9-22]